MMKTLIGVGGRDRFKERKSKQKLKALGQSLKKISCLEKVVD